MGPLKIILMTDLQRTGTVWKRQAVQPVHQIHLPGYSPPASQAGRHVGSALYPLASLLPAKRKFSVDHPCKNLRATSCIAKPSVCKPNEHKFRFKKK
jgi:hypothetical protein